MKIETEQRAQQRYARMNSGSERRSPRMTRNAQRFRIEVGGCERRRRRSPRALRRDGQRDASATRHDGRGRNLSRPALALARRIPSPVRAAECRLARGSFATSMVPAHKST